VDEGVAVVGVALGKGSERGKRAESAPSAITLVEPGGIMSGAGRPASSLRADGRSPEGSLALGVREWDDVCAGAGGAETARDAHFARRTLSALDTRRRSPSPTASSLSVPASSSSRTSPRRSFVANVCASAGHRMSCSHCATCASDQVRRNAAQVCPGLGSSMTPGVSGECADAGAEAAAAAAAALVVASMRIELERGGNAGRTGAKDGPVGDVGDGAWSMRVAMAGS
jgi:hypothetical protein